MIRIFAIFSPGIFHLIVEPTLSAY